MSQLSYSTYQSAAFPGMLYDNGDNDVLSYVSEEASANMPFGIALAKGAADFGALLMVNGSSVVIGVAQHVHNVDPGQVAATPAGAGVPPKYPVNVLKRGRIWVSVEQAVTPASNVFVRHTAGAGGTQKGAFRTDADTATAVQVTNGMRFLTSTTGAGLAVLEVNFP